VGISGYSIATGNTQGEASLLERYKPATVFVATNGGRRDRQKQGWPIADVWGERTQCRPERRETNRCRAELSHTSKVDLPSILGKPSGHALSMDLDFLLRGR
jgi:hypothetical protein